MRGTRKDWWLKILGLLLVFAVIASACGDDDEGSDSASGDDASDSSGDDSSGDDSSDDGTGDGTADDGGDDPLAGCGEGAVTDLSPDREVARCEPGYPAPQPLEERASVRLATNFWGFEFTAPYVLALELGEFEKENLDVEVVTGVSLADGIVQMEDCTVDITVGGTEASLHNGIAAGLTVKQVIGNYFPPDAGDTSIDQTGLWARADAFTDPENPDLTELRGTTLGTAVALGSVINYPIGLAFQEAGVSLLDLDMEVIPSADLPLALENGAVQSAWVLDPIWLQLADNPDYVLVATQPPGEALGGLYASACFREDRREVAVAFIRALIRTMNTYLAEGYKTNNVEELQVLADVADIPLESFTGTPETLMDWEMGEGTSERAQGFFMEYGVLEYDEIIPEDQVYDRSIYLEAVRGPEG
ncbi:MAG: hypothetical protein R8F63_20100 [Acidimicrobiales bacterium]|nr:hypothetical protein [Acidimicrobiales bacterium]